MSPRSLAVLLERQDGVLTRLQAIAHGMTPDGWQWQIASGRWQRLLPGVAVNHSGGVSTVQRAWAAVLSCGPDAALTGDTALFLMGVPVGEPTLWRVAVPGRQLVVGQPRLPAPGRTLVVQPHRVTRLDEVVHPTRTPPVVRPAAALLHAAAWAPSARAAEWRVASAVQRGLVTPAQVREAGRVLTRTRRRALVAEVLLDVEVGAHARSELDLLRLLRDAGLPCPDRLQRPVRTATGLRYLDAWWERQRVALEVDGGHHRLVGTWEADLLRANAVAVAHRDDRLLLLRFTTGQLRHERDLVLAQLCAALLP